MKNKSLYVVVSDKDRKLFNVQGPLSNVSGLNRRVAKAQEAGRAVICFASNKPQKKDVIQNAKKSANYEDFDYVDFSLV